MENDMIVKLITAIVPVNYQAYITLALFLVYIVGNAVMPFLPNQANGWEHAVALFIGNLWKAWKAIRDVSKDIPVKSSPAQDTALVPKPSPVPTSPSPSPAPPASPVVPVAPTAQSAPATPAPTATPQTGGTVQ